MKLVCVVLVVSALAIFTLACSTETNTNQTASNTKTQSSPAASPTIAAAATPAATPASTDSAGDDIAAARTTFAQQCAVCHGEGGEGTQMGNMKVPSLNAKDPVNDSDAELARHIANGGKGMPPFKGKLKPEEIQALVRYIRQDIQRK